jgi:hypothetical protein
MFQPPRIAMRHLVSILILSIFCLFPVIGCESSGGGSTPTDAATMTPDVVKDVSSDGAPPMMDASMEGGGGTGIIVGKISGSTREDGTKATFTVVLGSLPKGDVVVNLDSDDKTEGTVDKTKLTFTTVNWNAPQTVTVTGVNDDLADGDQTYGIAFTATMSADTFYAAITPAKVAVVNVDNDSAGITVSTISNDIREDGTKATFTVVLNSQPSAEVTVHFDSDKKTEGTVDKTALTFTTMNWNAKQTVTVTGVDDTAADGNQVFGIAFTGTTGTDAAYAAITPAKVAVTNIDNDMAGVTVSLMSGTTKEDATQATFTAVLNTQPTADVTLHFDSNDKMEGTVDKTALTFTAMNWNAKQTVTVTGVDDNLVDGDQPFAIAFTATTSTDTRYAGITPANVAVTNVDNDTANVSVSTISRKTGENGQQATFTVVLNSQPTANVTLNCDSNDKTEGTVDKTSLAFTTVNWNAPQTVTVTGVNDDLADGEQSYAIVFTATTSTDPAYSGVIPSNVAVANIDNDTAGIAVEQPSGDTTESGGQATFTVVLNSMPTAAVTVNFNSNKTGEGTVDKTSLTFSTANWNAPQTVTVTGVNDNVVDGDQSYAVVFTATTSTDTGYSGKIPEQAALVNLDDDTPGVITNDISQATRENGQQGFFSVVLRTQPSADVVVHFNSDDTGEGTVGMTSLTFTSANWAAPQFVAVTGVDDNLADGDQPYDIVFTATTSTDTNYAGIIPAAVHVTNIDNDTAGILVGAASGNTREDGQQAMFTIVLRSQPTADVTVGFNSNDVGEGTLDKTSVTFTSVNWNAPQTVTATGIDDSPADGNQPYAVVFTAATSADTNYAGLTPGNLAMLNVDNDTAGVTVGPISRNTQEDGTQAMFTIVLNSQPFQPVTVRCNSSDLGEGTVDKTHIDFTTANWNSPQTVTVTGQPDNFVDGDQPYQIRFIATSSDDLAYAGIVPPTISLLNIDNDTKGFTVSAISRDTKEDGTTATFTVKLNSIPTGITTAHLDSNDLGEGTVDQTALVFTAANWNAPKTVIVTGINDDLADGRQPYAIVFTATTSADPGYVGIVPANVDVGNVDDDTAGFTVSAITGDTSEAGGTATFTVKVNSQPFNDVTVNFDSNRLSEGTVNVTSLTFTSGVAWSVPQTVTVTGVNDNLADSTQPYSIVFSATTSTDTAYAALTPSSVSVNNTDNDSAGITVSAISAHTTEAAGTATFTVVLQSQPFDNVTVNFDTDDTSEGTVNTTSLLFTAGAGGTWNVPQTVTVTGIDDSVADGNQGYAVAFSATTSNDLAYAAITPPNVAITNDDNDSAGIIVTAISGHTTEAGGTATFTVKLNSQPQGTVTVHFDSNNMTEGTVTVTSLAFDSGDWNTPKSVVVTGANDSASDCETTYAIVFTATTGGDAAYNAITPANVAVINDDDDSGGLGGFCVNWLGPTDGTARTCPSWLSYTGTLTGAFSSIEIKGSNNPAGLICSDATAATTICNALQTHGSASVLCQGNTWRVGICNETSPGVGAVEISVNYATCNCGTGAANQAEIRPCWVAYNNGNQIGGIGAGSTCSNPAQTMSVRCIR